MREWQFPTGSSYQLPMFINPATIVNKTSDGEWLSVDMTDGEWETVEDMWTRKETEANVSGLSVDIRRHGVRTPIVLTIGGTGKRFRVTMGNGHHRVASAFWHEIPYIPVIWSWWGGGMADLGYKSVENPKGGEAIYGMGKRSE